MKMRLPIITNLALWHLRAEVERLKAALTAKCRNEGR